MPNPTGTPRNLRAFPKGVSGNPGGRPRGWSITRLVRAELQKPSADDPTITNAEAVAARVVELAAAGDRVFAPLVWRYMDGEPKDAPKLALDELAGRLSAEFGIDKAQILADYARLTAPAGA